MSKRFKQPRTPLRDEDRARAAALLQGPRPWSAPGGSDLDDVLARAATDPAFPDDDGIALLRVVAGALDEELRLGEPDRGPPGRGAFLRDARALAHDLLVRTTGDATPTALG